MKILQVSAHYPPDFVSGGTLVPQRFALATKERGHESFVFTGDLNTLEPLAERDSVEKGIDVHWVGVSSFLAWDDEKIYNNPAVATRFERDVSQLSPEVVHFHSMQTLGGELLRIAKEAGAAVVLTMHDFWWSCARQFFASRELEPCTVVAQCSDCPCSKDRAWLAQRDKWLASQLAYADIILAPSRSAANVYIANGAPEDKVFVNENGVEAMTVKRQRVSGEPVRFMYAGGEDPVKGYSTLRRACEAASVPQGTTLDLYNASADGFPSWVSGHEPYSRETIGEIFAAHDVLILPSIMRESHSIVTREALSAGLAVIVTDTLGPQEAVRDGFNGRIASAGDAASLTEAIEDLSNVERCESMMGRGSVTPIVSIPEQIDELFDYYDKAVAVSKELEQTSPISNVLIVTGIQGAPGRYRGYFPVEALGTVGVSAQLRYYRDPALPELAAQADAVVFYRVPATRQILDLIEEIRRTDTPIVGDVDDLIFDPEIEPLLDNLDRLSKAERDLWRRGIYRYRTTLEHCDYFIGSTQTISEQATRLLGVPAHTWNNGVGAKIAQASERALKKEREAGPLRIGYFSGTDTHDADWATIEDAVIRILDERPDVELWLGGLIEPTEKLGAYTQRIRRLPFVSWHELPVSLHNLDVCLAPLTADSIFNEAKSAIKWLESALALTPTVAYPSQPFAEAIEHGVTGMLASTTDEWYEAISTLLDNEPLRRAMARDAKASVLMELSPARQGTRYLHILEQARELVASKGHKEPSSWEDVYDDEPFSGAGSVLEPYEIPTGRVVHSSTIAILARSTLAGLRADGILPTFKRVASKLYRMATSK
ncbi:MAG: glycosyltransferase [Actinomycetaceae bacterium]|nr:glycosyltransferase [Actinomycetaceae bacterium]